MPSLNDIRSTFLDFFARNGHRVVESSPLVPRNDPTLMFANSGMVQLKNLFTGVEQRDYKRATTAQKCVRARGKHNDLDNVGYTARHHTFFEMLGNFSFGNYFKEQAITYAWELLTRDFGLAKDRLLITVYHTDDEAAGIWKRVAGLPDHKIIRIASDDTAVSELLDPALSLRALHLSTHHGHAVGDDGVMFTTHDQGRSWEPIALGLEQDLLGLDDLHGEPHL